jgi:hypothetical protein
LPFPVFVEDKKKEFIFRVVFKPETGILWGFNEFTIDKDLVHTPNFKELLKNGGAKSMDASSVVEDEVYQGTNSISNLDNSQFLHSRLNLMDDQVTINYDLSQPSMAMDQKKLDVKKKRLSK